MSRELKIAICSAVTLILSAPALAEDRVSPASLEEARSVLSAAENAAAQAHESAIAAQAAADRANAQLEAAKKLLAEITARATGGDAAAPPQQTRKSTPVASVHDRSAENYAGCPKPDASISQRAYFEAVADCEKSVLKGEKLNQFKARETTGVGTTIAAASSGATATFKLENVSNYRAVSTRDFGPFSNVEQQRVSRRRMKIGVRADINKDDKSVATIATLGQLDRLSSNIAIFAEYGRDYSASEPFHRTADRSKWSFVEERATAAEVKLAADCIKAGNEDCEGLGLIRWILSAKDQDFANPDAVKLYNDIFWGPPPVDKEPRFGWSIRGELGRPKFDYYPFALTKVADPFKPGKTKTVIDPAQFPTDFASRIVENEAHLNWALTVRGFFHVGPTRERNYLTNHGVARLVPYVDHVSGTTFLATASYLRTDEIEKPFRDVKVCPLPHSGQPFFTDQTCTSLNIAAPARTTSFVFGGEVRQGIQPFWIIPPTMISAKFTHDFKTDENGLIVPLYFADDNKGLFKGGLRFAHSWGGENADGSRKKPESIFGVVVGVSIGLDGTTDVDD